MAQLQIDILGVSETHWITEIGQAFEQNKYEVIHSCRTDNLHRQGIATLEMEDGPWTLFQIYAPDTSYIDVQIGLFYENLQDRINVIPIKNNKMFLGDFNDKVGCNAYTTGKMYVEDSVLAA